MAWKGPVLSLFAASLIVGVPTVVSAVAVPAVCDGRTRLVVLGSYTGIVLLALVCYVRTMWTDPGFIPKAQGNCLELYMEQMKSKGLPVCETCQIYKPSRTHHCSQCARCVYLMDHHCPWVNNCVGAGNQKYFVLFLLYTFIAAVYGATLLGWGLLYLREKDLVITGVTLMITSGFGGFTLQLLLEQWYYIYMNVSLVDILQGKEIPRVSAHVAAFDGQSEGDIWRASLLALSDRREKHQHSPGGTITSPLDR